MAEGLRAGSHRQGDGHSDREDGMCRDVAGGSRSAGCRLEPVTRPEGGAGAKRSCVETAAKVLNQPSLTYAAIHLSGS